MSNCCNHPVIVCPCGKILCGECGKIDEEANRKYATIHLGIGLILGGLGTIGGWWMLLSMFGLQPAFPGDYTLLNAIIGLVTIATLFMALLIGGPSVVYDSVKNYRMNEGGE